MKEAQVETGVQVKRTMTLVRVCFEIAAIAVATAAIGTWFILQYPSVVMGQEQLVTGFGDDTSNSVHLAWTAPGDDGMIGQATSYDIRYATSTITDATWGDATPVDTPPTPGLSGHAEQMLVGGLIPNTTYYFALKTGDEAGNWSPLSNIATWTTGCVEAWSCTSWGACQNGLGTRQCTDLNNCGTQVAKPAETHACNGNGNEPPPPEGGEQIFLQETFVVTAPNAGSEPRIVVYRRDGSRLSDFLAYTKSFRGGVRVAVGDLGSDGVDEIVVAPGPGMEPRVKVFTYQGRLIKDFLAYPKSFTGGVNVAIGDIDGKPGREIVTVPASKGSANIRVFSYKTNKYSPIIQNFFAFPKRYRGSWNIAAADIDKKGRADIIVTPGAGTGAPKFRVFEYRSKTLTAKRYEVTTFPMSFRGGVTLATGDLNKDAYSEVIVAPETRGASHVRVYGRRFDGTLVLKSPGFLAFTAKYLGGLTLATGDFTYDGKPEIVAAVRSGDRALIRIYRSDGKKVVSEFTAYGSKDRFGLSGIATGHFFPPK